MNLGAHQESRQANDSAAASEAAGWYCIRTKPKHEHIAAANLARQAALQVFCPRLRIERVTRRGIVRAQEPLFPCYLFVRCIIDEKIDDLRYAYGVGALVSFG